MITGNEKLGGWLKTDGIKMEVIELKTYFYILHGVGKKKNFFTTLYSDLKLFAVKRSSWKLLLHVRV